jgi:hypothetical protein
MATHKKLPTLPPSHRNQPITVISDHAMASLYFKVSKKNSLFLVLICCSVLLQIRESLTIKFVQFPLPLQYQTSNDVPPATTKTQDEQRVGHIDQTPMPVVTGAPTATPIASTEAPTNSQPKSNRLPKFLVGIFCTKEDVERRQFVRDSILSFYKDTHDRNSTRICSLNDLLLLNKTDIIDCQIAYVFVAGGLEKGPTQLLMPNETHPITIPAPTAQKQESDLVFLNIKENMNDGKTPTYYKYASMVAESFENTPAPFHFVIKMDLDTMLFVPNFLAYAQEHFPLDIKQVNIGKKIQGGISKYLWGSGAFQIVSVDLAKAITCPESVGKMERAEDEDKEISKRVNFFGTNATRIWIDEKHLLYQPSKTPNKRGLTRKNFDFTDILYGHTEWGSKGRWSRMTPGPYFKYLPKARKIWRHFLYWYTHDQVSITNLCTCCTHADGLTTDLLLFLFDSDSRRQCLSSV